MAAIRETCTDLRDPRCFARVYDAHASAVHASALAILRDPGRAEDVVQDVFLRLWRRPEAFDVSRGPLGPYLRLMARSRALDLWRETEVRERARRRVHAEATDAATLNAPERPDEALLRSAERSRIGIALQRLPQDQREAVVLAYWGNRTAEDIAAEAGIPLGTAKSRIRLGLQKLRRLVAAPVPAQDLSR